MVRRVLRDDGVLWLNLGSSYASGDTNPSPSPLLRRASAYDSDGKESPDFRAADRACHDLCDERRGAIPNHRDRSARSDQCDLPGEQRTSRTARDTGRSGSAPASPDALLRGVQASTTQRSSDRLLDACGPEEMVSVYQQAQRTASPASPPSARTTACIPGTSPKSPPLVVRTRGKESFFSACQRSDCKGIGRCGLCWCSLAIPSLNVKDKDLISIPHLVAMALQADGWVLRRDVVWSKPNPMPESVGGWRWERHRVKVGSGGVARHGLGGSREPHGAGITDRPQPAKWEDCPGCPRCEPHGGLVLHDGSRVRVPANQGRRVLLRL